MLGDANTSKYDVVSSSNASAVFQTTRPDVTAGDPQTGSNPRSIAQSFAGRAAIQMSYLLQNVTISDTNDQQFLHLGEAGEGGYIWGSRRILCAFSSLSIGNTRNYSH